MNYYEDNDWYKEVNGWIDISNKKIRKRNQKIDQGSADQSTHTGLAGWLEYLGLAKFLRDDAIEDVRKTFRQSAECIETSFRMAYDENHPGYLGEKFDPAEVSMTDAIDGFHAALIAGDFDAGRHLAQWARITCRWQHEIAKPNNDANLVANYMHALKYIFLGDDTKALEYARATETWFAKKGEPTKNRFHRNFFHRCRMVRAILEKDPDLFEASMEVQLKSHAWEAVHDDIADTPEAYIYVDGVALCNLALSKGMKINFEAGVIPEGLLIGA